VLLSKYDSNMIEASGFIAIELRYDRSFLLPFFTTVGLCRREDNGLGNYKISHSSARYKIQLGNKSEIVLWRDINEVCIYLYKYLDFCPLFVRSSDRERARAKHGLLYKSILHDANASRDTRF